MPGDPLVMIGERGGTRTKLQMPKAVETVRQQAHTPRVKRAIVISLERLCGTLDNIPMIWHDHDGWRFYRHGLLGCYPLCLAQHSAALDDRWDTRVWVEPSRPPEAA